MKRTHLLCIVTLLFALAELPPTSAQLFTPDPLGGFGHSDGTGSAARLDTPAGVAVDSAGNIYVTDGGATIRKITLTGVVSTLAGLAGGRGTTDGTRSDARFNEPLGIAVDSAGNIYVADFGNHTIRKIAPDGMVSTLAGLAGNRGDADGMGSEARFRSPTGVALDRESNVYVVDGNDTPELTIRKITPDGVVSTLAGLGGRGGNDSLRPSGVAVDSAGNIYVADGRGPQIQRITPDGEVSTLAGLAGSSGSEDGTGGDARFAFPSGVAVDSAGNVYVADSWNHTIRKITPDGEVSTLAGLAQRMGSDDGSGNAARFSRPQDVAVDSTGNVYVADSSNHTIRKITTEGAVSTLAGLPNKSHAPSTYEPYTFTTLVGNDGYGSADGTGSGARFTSPSGLAADSAGNVYVADKGNYTIRKVTPAGVVTTLAGLAGSDGSADGTSSEARFGSLTGVAVDAAGNVYVADSAYHTIRKMTPAGVVTTLAGLAESGGSADGVGSDARFFGPSGVAVDAAGNVYVADSGNRTIRKVTPAGVVTTLAGLAGSVGSADGVGSDARFFGPSGVAVDDTGNVYVADSITIRKVTPSGVVTTLAGDPSIDDFGQSIGGGYADGMGSDARFYGLSDAAVDSAGNIYVADRGNAVIRKVTPSGVVTTLAGLAGSVGSADGSRSDARFNYPSGVAVDGTGNVYLTDSANNTIRKITPAGAVTTLAGLAGGVGSADGVGSSARFNSPAGVAVDRVGNAYVADTGNHTIRKVTVAGVVATLAGDASITDESGNPVGGYADGAGSAARFNSPAGVAADGTGNLYVADSGNHTIRKITPTGVVITLAGLAGNEGNADGVGGVARFNSPRGVAVDSTGNLYVSDTLNYTIRKVTPTGVVTTLAGLAGSSGSADGTGSAARFGMIAVSTHVYFNGGPTGVAVDSAGNVYVADTLNCTIRKITPAGEVTTLAGLAGKVGSVDGTESTARFGNLTVSAPGFLFHGGPIGVAVDSAGNVFATDGFNRTIRKVTPAGVVTTLAGLADALGNDDGTGSSARFAIPAGVAVDDANNIYVTDNNTIRKGYQALRIVNARPAFGFNGGQFGFVLTGPAGRSVIVEASTDLVNWLSIWTNTIPGVFNFSDPESGASSQRFYRGISTGP